MPSPTHNPFVTKIFPVTPFNSKISTLVPRYPSDSKRSGGGGWRLLMSIYPSSIPRCQHLKINGTQCGSPALRRNHYCYFHKRWHETRIVLNANRARRARVALDLPVLEDANSVQVSLMQVMRLILNGQIDPKTAGLLLYALQTASSNLSRINFEPAVKTRVVIDPRTVGETPLGENPWRREDFEEEEYEEDDQAEACKPVAAKPEDVGIDKEWSAEETIPSIEAQAASTSSPGRLVRAAAPRGLAQVFSAPPNRRIPHPFAASLATI